jgi:alpha,alpha-trehalase
VRLFRAGKPARAARSLIEEPDYIAEELSLPMRSGESVTVEKIVALVTSRDPAISECGLRAQEAAQGAGRFEDLLQSHADAWAQLWRRCEIQLAGCEPRAEMILRLHIFHLLQTVSPNSVERDVGVPARGWHGEAYRGHVFWEELFIFPFLNLRLPEITRSLLRYRYRRLGEARRAAAEAGFRGAMYPWQSGSTGREESQALHLNLHSGRWIPDNSHRQRHINAAIAYIGCIELRLRYQGRWLEVIVERERLRLRADADAIGPIRCGFEDRIYEVQPGECRAIEL